MLETEICRLKDEIAALETQARYSGGNPGPSTNQSESNHSLTK